MAEGEEAAGFLFEALLHHLVYALGNALAQDVAGMGDDGFLDGEGAAFGRLVDEGAVGGAGGEGDFEGALYADAVGGVDGAVVVGVEGAEHGSQAFDAFVA